MLSDFISFPQLCDVLEALDDIRDADRAASGKTSLTVPRIDLGRVDVDPPNVPIYPFMQNDDWFHDHIEGTLLQDQLEILSADPKGFGNRKDEIISDNDEETDEGSQGNGN